MQLTINRIRELLFNKESEYCKWNKKGGKSAYDPFLGVIFGFLDTNRETQKAYQQILYTESSHDNFCRGSLRSDGYYPVKAINEWIYSDISANSSDPDHSQTIQELKSGYKCLLVEFEDELSEESRVFTDLISIESCIGSRPLYEHLKELLEQEEYLLVLAWMTVIAVFPQVTSVTEKKPDYAQSLLKVLFADKKFPTEAPSLHSAYESFLEERLAIDDEIEEGKAISTDPAAGKKAKAGDTIVIYISQGKEEKTVKVPNLSGLTESAAKGALESNTLTAGNVSYEFNSEVASGLVIRQSVPADTEVKEKTTVDFVISNGAEKKSYKGTVTGSISTADETLAASTVTVNVYINDEGGYHLAYTTTQSGATIDVNGAAGGLGYNNGTVSFTVVDANGADVSSSYNKSLTLSYQNE